MLIGVPKEIKDHEYRVGLVPGAVRELIAHGHQVLLQTTAGEGIGATDEHYTQLGAEIAADAAEVYRRAEMIIKVKEPQVAERALLRPGQILFAFLHLAPDPRQTQELIDGDAVCIAFETITSAGGGLPLLSPMSAVAGRMSIQAAAHTLEKSHGGKGLLLGGVPGVEPAKVVILGGGVVGTHAATIAVGMGARVTVLDRDHRALDRLWRQFGSTINTLYSTRDTVESQVLNADVVVGGVLVAGAAAPKLVTRQQVAAMQPGSVVVDVAIDQGGCFETSRVTTHSDPSYLVDRVAHYCVANMPGVVPGTSSFALNNALLPHALVLADKGYRRALRDDPHLRDGLNVHRGTVTCRGVAESLGHPYVEAMDALRAPSG